MFNNGDTLDGKIRFDMVHIELRYPRDPVATFSGDYDGEGSYSGMWTSLDGESGLWTLQLRDTIKPHDPGPHWYGET